MRSLAASTLGSVLGEQNISNNGFYKEKYIYGEIKSRQKLGPQAFIIKGTVLVKNHFPLSRSQNIILTTLLEGSPNPYNCGLEISRFFFYFVSILFVLFYLTDLIMLTILPGTYTLSQLLAER